MNHLPSLGALFKHPHIDDWVQSKPVAVGLFNGQAITVVLELDTFDGLSEDDVEATVKRFLALTRAELLQASAKVLENYEEVRKACDMAPLAIKSPEDVWTYVTLSEAYVVRRHRRDQDLYVQIACKCEWEPEHGLQLVYRRGATLVRVSDQDGHLTEADARDLPEESERNEA
jgi:hypothetical protein